MARGIIPFGYTMADGVIQIVPEEAKKLKQMCKSYLSGQSMVGAAKSAGLKVSHGWVKRVMLNPRYLGNEYYPPILTQETQDAIRSELQRREEKQGDRGKRLAEEPEPIPTKFYMKQETQAYEDPYQQAEYLYSLIESEDLSWLK